ncbi:hypothetical protein COE80_07185 [Bacillus pseudomycoides]|nr:hypothetical protein COE80_07185 [Bacillus pseudomycoides]
MSSPAFICIVLTTYYLQKEGNAIHKKKSAHPIRETAKKLFFLGERGNERRTTFVFISTIDMSVNQNEYIWKEWRIKKDH